MKELIEILIEEDYICKEYKDRTEYYKNFGRMNVYIDEFKEEDFVKITVFDEESKLKPAKMYSKEVLEWLNIDKKMWLFDEIHSLRNSIYSKINREYNK